MKLYDQVYELLKNYPELRNSDKKLTWSIWRRELKLEPSQPIEYRKYLEATSFETISRARRKVQEAHPELGPSAVIAKSRESKKKSKGAFIFTEPFNGQLFNY